MTLETTSTSPLTGGLDPAPGDVFTAVVADGLEHWRVVAVLGIRVLAQRIEGPERRSFTLRFVRHRVSLHASGDDGAPEQSS